MCPSVSNRGERRGEPLSSTRTSHFRIPFRPPFSLFNLPSPPTCFRSLFVSSSRELVLPSCYCSPSLFISPISVSLFLLGYFTVPRCCLSLTLHVLPLPLRCHGFHPLSLHLSFRVCPISQMNPFNGPGLQPSRAPKIYMYQHANEKTHLIRANLHVCIL